MGNLLKIKNIIFCIFAFCLFLSANVFSQTVMRKAEKVNDAGKSAAQSHNAAESRSINNNVWDGSAKVSGADSTAGVVYIDVISDNGYALSQDSPSSFDSLKSGNDSLWNNMMIGMIASLGAAISLLVFSSVIIENGVTSEPVPDVVGIQTIVAFCPKSGI